MSFCPIILVVIPGKLWDEVDADMWLTAEAADMESIVPSWVIAQLPFARKAESVEQQKTVARTLAFCAYLIGFVRGINEGKRTVDTMREVLFNMGATEAVLRHVVTSWGGIWAGKKKE